MDPPLPGPRSVVTGGDSWTYTLDLDPAHAGAQGTVHFAVRGDGQRVAVKVAGPNAQAEQSLHHEIAMLRALEIAGVQGVVRVLDVIDVQDRPGMVMERYDDHLGAWLSQVTTEPGPDALDSILGRAATLARILAGVHSVPWAGHSLLHRDVKPENLFVDAAGRMALGDFGGAMAITGLQAVELALFGSPMYAPLDQILPGRAIPDPTWDTYALCVILYAALTGSRPAYQSDPRALLTPAGRELWALAQQAIHAEGSDAQRLRLAFAQERIGTTAADLIDPVGHSALNVHDRELLDERMTQLGELGELDPDAVRAVRTGVWRVLTQGLSPVSHPSPPNRYRNAADLAEQLEELRDRLHWSGTITPPSTRTPTPPPPPAREEHQPRARRGGAVLGASLAAAVLLFAAAVVVVLVRYPPNTWFAASSTALVPERTVTVRRTTPPDEPSQLVGAVVELETDRLVLADEPVPVLLDFPTPTTAVTLSVHGPDDAVVDRRELGSQPTGEHALRWGDGYDPGVYRLSVVARAGDAPVEVDVRTTATATAGDDGGPLFGAEPIALDTLVAWTRPEVVAPFRIGRTEITGRRWSTCVEAGACEDKPMDGRAPVTGVSFEQAQAYCAFDGGAVPTEAQWLAAYGPRRYPWGDELPTCRHAHGAGCADSPQPVGLLTAGVTSEGVFDMAGNAWEWASGGTGDGPPVLLGGSVQTKGGSLGVKARRAGRRAVRSSWVGVRCAYAAD